MKNSTYTERKEKTRGQGKSSMGSLPKKKKKRREKEVRKHCSQAAYCYSVYYSKAEDNSLSRKLMLQRASLLLYYYCCYFVVVAVRQRKKKKVVSTCQFNHLTGLVSLLHEETTGARFTNLAKKENEKKKARYDNAEALRESR